MLTEKEEAQLRALEERQRRSQEPLVHYTPGDRIVLSLTAYEEALLRELRRKQHPS